MLPGFTRRIGVRVDHSLKLKTALKMGLALAIVLGLGGVYIVKVQRDAQYRAIDQKARILAESGATTTASLLTQALADGKLTNDQLFDTNYQQIPGTNPQRYHTAYDAFTDKAMQQIEDGYLKDQDVVFAAMVDQNGFLPTHNTVFSQGPLSDPNNRTKRLFNDPVGSAAAKNTAPVLKQVYQRDTGETMWDVSSPIVVNGEHWGAFRIGYSIQHVNATVASTTRTIILVLSGVFILGCLMAYLIARQIARSTTEVAGRLSDLQEHGLADLERGMGALAEGDLTVHLSPTTAKIERYSRDEVGQAAAAVNEIIDRMSSAEASYNDARQSLAGIVSTVADDAGQIMSAADQLQEASDQMAAATGQIATAINEVTRSTVALSSLSQDSAREVEQVSAGSEEMAAAVRTTASSAGESRREANSMGERIAQVATQSEQVAASANESRQAAVQGQQAVMHAVSSMEAIARAVERTSHTVDQLGEYGQQIGDIVKVIDEIAAQTNLLALNAAIEAARAGEQGRGFAVVADNVRTLAERSSQSTKEIAELIAKVQSGTQEAVEAMAAGVKDVQEGQEITSQAGKALDAIIGSVQDAAQRMQQIARDVQGLSSGAERIVGSADEIARLAEAAASSASGMAEGTGRVTDAIVQVSATSEQTSASAEEVSASTEQLSAQSEELAATSNSMKELARQLNEAARRFKWDAPGNLARR